MMAKRSGPTTVAPHPWARRLALVVSSWLYAYALHFAHANYLNPEWEYFGFTFEAPGWSELALIGGLVTAGAVALPATLARASSLTMILLFLVVYVPTVVISPCLDSGRPDRYAELLLALAFAFVLACLGARHGRMPAAQPDRIPGERFAAIMLVCWLLSCVILVYAYWSVMAIAGLEEVYEQRAAGASASLFMGYVQTYFSNVFSPALIAIGLVHSRAVLTVLGSVGCLLMYAIAAQRTVFLLPFAMIGLYLVLRSKFGVVRTSAVVVLCVAVVTAASAAYYEQSGIASLMSTYLLSRTLGQPGLTYSLYYELFSADGFTWWSHVRGISSLVSPPQLFAQDPLWPGLGYIVGERVYGNAEINFNANPFASDGIASAGIVGVVVMGFVLVGWCLLLDVASKGWDRRFVLLVTLPLGLALTNGSFFTTMLSFGGGFWLLVFQLYKPAAYSRRPPPRRPSNAQCRGENENLDAVRLLQ